MQEEIKLLIWFMNLTPLFWDSYTMVLEVITTQHQAAMREAVLYKLFLDLQKAHNALYRYSCLEIIAAYRVGPRALRILRM